MNIKAKLWIVVLLSLFGGLIAIVGNAYFSFLNLKEQNRIELEHRVHAAHQLLEYYYKQSQNGTLDAAKAHQMAIEAIRATGMSNPAQYVWIHDLGSPIPRMVMHPFYPELSLKILNNPQFYCTDAKQFGSGNGETVSLNGKENLFVAMNDVVKSAGKGYVFYQWTKPLPSGKHTQEEYEKSSYVELFEPWGWVVGSGIYQDEMIHKAFVGFLKSSAILLLYIFLIFVVAVWIYRSITQPIRSLLLAVQKFKTDHNHRAAVQTKDEIGILSSEFNSMADVISSQIETLCEQTVTLEEQAATIEEHSEHLEELIEERTKELVKANKKISQHLDVIDQYVITSTTDTNGFITYVSKAFCELMGYSKEELLGQTHRMFKNPHNPKELYEEMWKTIVSGKSWVGELQNRAKNGTLHWLRVRISPIVNEDGKIVGYSAIREDINDKKEAQRLAVTDQLTKLYNRRKLDEVLEFQAALFSRYKQSFSLIMIDIDKFKDVNDQYGHQVGDEVLQTIAGLLRARVRETDIVGRWGGEEFLVILPNTTLENAIITAENLRKEVESHVLKTVGRKTISLGVSEYKENAQESVERADKALYKAKESGRNRVMFL